MSITATYIGKSTVQITASGTTNTFSDLTNAVKDAILGTQPNAAGASSGITFAQSTGVTAQTASGWTLHDSFTSGIIFTQVFKSINADAVTYKYIILNWNTVMNEINVSCCEGWNATTHVAMNEVHTYNNCAPVNFQLDTCDILLMIHPHWLVVHSYLNNEPSLWAGVFEFAREDAADTGALGVPCFGWISSTLGLIGAGNYSAVPCNGNDNTLICVPRTKSGSTGLAAAKSWAANYGATTHPTAATNVSHTMPYRLGNQVNSLIGNTWDSTKRFILPIKPIHKFTLASIENKGVIFGLKTLAPVGQNMNKEVINCDSDGNYSYSGTPTDHWMLNQHHKSTASNTSWIYNTNLTSATYAMPQKPIDVAYIGKIYYVLTSANVVKLEVINAAATTLITGGTNYMIKYDGERYIYISTANGLTRIDTRDDSVSNLAITNGIKAFSINQTHIIGSQSTASAAPTITRVSRSTFTVDGTPQQTPTLADTVIHIDSCVDYAGYVYFAAAFLGATGYQITRIHPTTSAISQINFFNPGVASPYSGAALLTIDANYICFARSSDGGAGVTSFGAGSYLIDTKLFNINSVNGASTTIAACANSNYRQNLVKVGGTIVCATRGGANAVATPPAYVRSTDGVSSLPMSQTNISQFFDANTPTIDPFFTYDGARFITNDTSNRLKIWSGVNGIYTSAGVTLGQMAIPA